MTEAEAVADLVRINQERIARIPRSQPQPWTSRRMLLALSGHFSWLDYKMMPEFEIDGGRADLVFITRAGQLTEVEIKISLSDWHADKTKEKFAGERPHISRFYYAVPETLADKIPSWVPASAGILRVYDPLDFGHDRVEHVREAERVRAKKITAERINKIHEACYYRFWRRETQQLRDELQGSKVRA